MRFVSCGNRLENDLIQQPSLKHVVMSCVTDDVSNVKDFESYEIGLRVCSEKQGTALQHDAVVQVQYVYCYTVR